MSYDYSGLAETAINQIADKGRAVTLVYKTQGTYVPASDTITGQSSTTQTVKMLITNYNKREVNETLIKSGDLLGILANDSLTRAPKTSDQVTDGGETYSVVNVEYIKPGPTVLIYKLQLRKG